MALTPKQARFVTEYLKDLNAAGAYKRVGYRAKNDHVAAVNASLLMAKHDIRQAIEAGRKRQQEEAEVDAVRVLKEYAAVALSDLGDIIDFSGPDPRLRPANEIPEHARRAISSMKVRRVLEGTGETAREVEIIEFRLWPKLDALKEVAARVEPQKPPQPLPGSTPENPVYVSGGLALHVERYSAALLSAAAREETGRPGTDGLGEPLHPRIHQNGTHPETG